MRLTRLTQITRSRHAQQGAETVEMLITFPLFLLVFIMIIDFAITVYDRGTLIDASRVGSRQASLYWVDPALSDPETPEQNQLLKRLMVESVMTWSETRLLVDPADAGVSMTLKVNAVSMNSSTEAVSAGDVVSVGITYPHSYIGLSNLTGVSGPSLTAQTGQGVE